MLRFEWDPVKARVNLRKHFVSFKDAMHVFEAPYALFEQEITDVPEKTRWRALGLAGGVAVLLVVHTFGEDGGDEIVLIISARQATRKERNRYEQSRTQDLD
jgi:uncharacterized DUF497 family protein